jgi:hypothetical protein
MAVKTTPTATAKATHVTDPCRTSQMLCMSNPLVGEQGNESAFTCSAPVT